MAGSHHGRIHVLALCAVLATAIGCGEDQVDFGGDTPAPGSDMGTPGPTPDGGGPVDCRAAEYRGETYDCTALNRCTETNFQYRLACCECDPGYCNPDPTCNAAPDGGVPGPDADGGSPPPPVQELETCMNCHNGGQRNDYSGPGLSNPHPFQGAENIPCTGCHGGNPKGAGKLGSHVPPPPGIGDRQYQVLNPKAFFNRRTLAGIDKLEPEQYTSPDQPDKQWTNLDYLQFVNPGDLRVVEQGRGCGAEGCHFNQHAQWVPRTPIATSVGLFSGSRFHTGVENAIPEHRGRHMDGDSLGDYAPRDVSNPAYNPNTREIGEMGHLVEFPERGQWDGPFRQNASLSAAALANDVVNAAEDPERPNRVRAGSNLDMLTSTQFAITCGDCHLYSAGQNDRYADFRSSGCTACHMEYSYDGRSRSNDPNVPKNEPANPDAIAPGERAHVLSHQIRNVAKILPNGAFQRGISDRACVGCHQGSNRTVLQYWGIRLDQNQDLVNNLQYPANPVTFATTANDERLYDPAVANATFNGRNANQYILLEDYDGDNRDDTPPDVHYEAGLGCIDCHGSRDLHGGGTADPAANGRLMSHQDQNVLIRCQSCHGEVEAYAATAACTTYDQKQAQCVVDAEGNPLRHVTKDAQANFWLVSRLTGERHYIPQVRDVTVNNGRTHPINSRPLFSPKASYAMGRADGNPDNGIGPQQADPTRIRNGFSHMDNMDCVACHGSWQNNCIGCHLKTQYDVNPNNYFFSNVTGERILFKQANADFIYQNPIWMTLGINSKGKITQVSPAEKTFYRYQDLNNVESATFAFSDRLGEGNNPANAGRNAFPALAHNQMAAHSIRGKIADDKEGPRYCVSCHLNDASLAQFGAQYAAFRAAYANNNFAQLNFNLLKQHIGQNPGNQLNSPFFVHMAAGLGTGLMLFDEEGCPENPLDQRDQRGFCNQGPPANNFNANNVKYDSDRIVEANGVPNSSSSHPRLTADGKQRIGSSNPEMAGTLDAQTIQKLADPNNGRILDSWIDANGAPQGGAANFLNQ